MKALEIGVKVLLGASIGMFGLIKQISSAVYKELFEIFQESKTIAKQTGKMLATALYCNYPFKNQTVSFVGFSLGC